MTHRVFRTVLVGLVIALVFAACDSGPGKIPRGEPQDPARDVPPSTVKIVHILDVPDRSRNYIELEVGKVPGASKYEAQVMWNSRIDRYDVGWTEDWSKLPANLDLRWTGSGVEKTEGKKVPGITHLRVVGTGTISLRARALVSGEWTDWKTTSLVLS